nr:hypothetical protein [Tanacetum cinerariifolium]
MFPRFVQAFLDSQVEDMVKHKEIYVTPSQTKKIFANIKRKGKEFSGKVTPLLDTMMKQKSKKSKKRITEVPQLSDYTHDVANKPVTTTFNDPLLSGSSTRVESFKDAGLGDQEDASKHGRMIADLDDDERVALVDETQGRNDQDMFDTSILDDEEVVAEKEVTTADPVTTAGEVVTTASVEKQKSKKPKKRITEVPQLSDSTHDVANEPVTTTFNDPLLSGEDRLKLIELMELCTQLQLRVLDLETIKANQTLEIGSLKRRVESFEDAGLGDQDDASKQGRMIADLDDDERVALVDETQGRNDQDMFDTSILDDKEVVAEKEVTTADPVTTAGEVVTTAGVEVSTAAIPSQISIDEITLAKALIDIKTSKPKIMIDEEVARNLEAQMQAELEEEERLGRQKEEKANIALIES